ncbi:right-handed parallel beta-helix repeat-containing protein [Propionicimonas sp.]|uniref:right-handed parallel beta-helix repeat-containing protein n=1 Tax=Propionicimonas sp. TaxID=1955623 RepID=UPI0039E61048
MNTLVLRGGSLAIALAATAAALLVPVPVAVAATTDTVQAAADAFGLRNYSVVEAASADAIVTAARKSPASTIIHIPSGKFTVSDTIRPANGVYLAAESGTTVTWRGGTSNLVRFADVSNTGIYGGTWDAAAKGTNAVGTTHASGVKLRNLTITKGATNGLGVYDSSSVDVVSVTTTANKQTGVYVGTSSTLTASKLVSTMNQRNGVQVTGDSSTRATISDSTLDKNGQAVKGSTTGKTGHGLGVADAASVVVSNSSISSNKVCGVSLTSRARVTISGSSLDNNGRHGLGTQADSKGGPTADITNSTAKSNGYNGILSSGKGTNVTLRNVTISSSKQMGLSLPSGGSASVSGTDITKSGKQGISVAGSGTLTLGGDNAISSGKAHGIAVSKKGTLVVSGQNNVVADNKKNGLLMTGSGTSGSIAEAVSFENNKDYNGRVLSKAKLRTVPCIFVGKGKNKTNFTTAKSGSVTVVG